MTGSATWTAIRLGGLAAWLLLGATVIVGLLAASRLLGRGVSRSSLERVHRRLGELMTVAIAIHLVALLLDQYLPFSVADLAVPLASSWRPVAVAFGVVAAWLVVAVMVSSMLKSHLPRRVWHAIHMASYAAFAATSVHLMAAGTDAWLWPVQVLNVGMCGLVVGLAALALGRLVRRRDARPVRGAPARPRPESADLPRPVHRPVAASHGARPAAATPRRIPRRSVVGATGPERGEPVRR